MRIGDLQGGSVPGGIVRPTDSISVAVRHIALFLPIVRRCGTAMLVAAGTVHSIAGPS